MLLKELLNHLESWAPLQLQESYDNSGLLIGSRDQEVKKAILSLDCTEGVIDEAIREGADLIISHHPPVFSGMKRFNGNTATERIVMKAIANNMAIYSAHTNLDNATGGVSFFIAEKLGLSNVEVLSPFKGHLKKLVTFCPRAFTEKIRDALFSVGAGELQFYSECSFSSSGIGTFKAGNRARPFVGSQGSRHTEEEDRLECIYPEWLETSLLKVLKRVHPYELPAFDLIQLDNELISHGAGVKGNLTEPLPVPEFLELINKNMKAPLIRYTAFNQLIKKVACCGGSGSFLLQDAIRSGCDAFLTADFKYHQFFDAEKKIMIADIGHFESEQFTPELLYKKLSGKFPSFALQLSKEHTNPIHYYYGNNC